jgi:2-keto-4-pentenoate hydratase
VETARQTVTDQASSALLGAYTSGVPIPPLQEKFGPLTVDDSYQIQLRQVNAWLADGRRIAGHKVGLTSAAMQRQLGVTSPDFGHLMADMFYPEHEAVPRERFLQPRVEPEVAFILKRDLRGPGVNVADAVRAVEYVLPALEIIDSRIADWKIGLIDTIADNASSAGVVLGSRPVHIADVDLRLAGCVLRRNGEIAATGAGGAVLSSPINALVWVANVLGSRGASLEAGHVVLPGSMTAALPFDSGDVVSSTVAGLGTVTARMGVAR